MRCIRGTLALALSSALCLSACGENSEPIRVGATMSATGAYATQGIAARNGYELCASHVNAAGGVLGRPIELVIYDDESSSEQARILYQQLITADKVDAIMGPYGSTLTEAVAPITERYRMVHISPLAATTSIWEQGRHHLFMVLPPAELFLVGLLELAKEQGLEKVAVLQEQALFPAAAASGAVAHAKANGLAVLEHYTYPSGTADFSAYLNDMAERGVEVLAMTASALDDFISVRSQLNVLGIELQLFGNSGAVDQYYAALGEAADGDLGLSAWEPSVPNPGAGAFVTAYEETYGLAPSFHAAGGYGSCQLFVQAIETAGSLHSDAMREALLNMDTQTVFGAFKVDKRGYQIANQGVFVQWQQGRKEVVWPAELATAPLQLPALNRAQ
ncbi:amino acid ABC transporter substrate-binding protein [Aliidiomarina sp.]|uniref:amino acid ABC transporter substrate-binding protein n=1 Tax=Aliidiomarina sp. TaxID=1872439 RepID=UPI003A4E269D